MIPFILSHLNDYKSFQELLKQIAESSQIPLAEMQESPQKLLDILHATAPKIVALPIKEAPLAHARNIWQTLVLITFTSMKADKRFQVSSVREKYLVSWVIVADNEKS